MQLGALNYVVLRISTSVWKDSRMIISYIAALSLIVVVIQALLSTMSTNRLRTHNIGHQQRLDAPISNETQSIRERLRQHVVNRGGGVIFAYQISRLDSAVIGFGLALATMLLEQDYSWESIALISTLVRHDDRSVYPTQQLITVRRAMRLPWLH
jgi:hypothetical protein